MAARASFLALLAVVLALAPAAPAKGKHWAHAEIQLVAKQGYLGGKAAGFRPDDPLTGGELAELASQLAERDAPAAADPAAPVTIGQLDAALVRALGLRDAAARFSDGVRAGGLVPPRNFGTEVVARRLGLRVNHEQGRDELEVSSSSIATRAEAAYSVARILRLDEWSLERVREEAAAFALPAPTGEQREILRTALSLVGNPYVWGGTSERPQSLFGKDVAGGFDCSGFVWRVFKLQPSANGALAATLKGRTTYAMSGEMKRAQRIPRAKLQPADLVFFGAGGAKAAPSDINHMGIYLGNNWFVHASDFGVAISPIADWYADRFAWGRRPLAEAA